MTNSCKIVVIKFSRSPRINAVKSYLLGISYSCISTVHLNKQQRSRLWLRGGLHEFPEMPCVASYVRDSANNQSCIKQ
jgi:hypothetical protein